MQRPPFGWERLEKFVDWLSILGRSPVWLERLLYFGKRWGLLPALGVIFIAGIPTAKYVLIPSLLSNAVSTIAEGYGLDLEIEDWSAEILDLAGTAHGVTLRTGGPYGRPELAQAEAIRLDLSIVRRFRTGSWISKVSLEKPSLYLERLNSGRWNWEEAVTAEPESWRTLPDWRDFPPDLPPYDEVTLGKEVEVVPAEPTPLSFSVPRLELKGLRVQWVENLPGQSGGGLIHSSKASIFLDDLQIGFQDLAGPVDDGLPPSRFSLDGRTGDGRVSLKGEGHFFRWSAGPSPGFRPQVHPVATGRYQAWSPYLLINLYLENVGAGVVSRMIPSSSILPASGHMSGLIKVKVENRRVSYITDLLLQSVSYVINPDSPAVRGQSQALQHDLRDYQASRRVAVSLEGNLDEDSYRPVHALQSAVTQEGVADASPRVRRAAAWDYQQLTGEMADTGLNVVSKRLSEQAGRAAGRVLGQEGGQAITQSLQQDRPAESEAEKDENAVKRGLKGAGRGIKRLFGGGKDKSDN